MFLYRKQKLLSHSLSFSTHNTITLYVVSLTNDDARFMPSFTFVYSILFIDSLSIFLSFWFASMLEFADFRSSRKCIKAT